MTIMEGGGGTEVKARQRGDRDKERGRDKEGGREKRETEAKREVERETERQ